MGDELKNPFIGKEKKKKRNFAFKLLVILLVILIIAFGGVFFYFYKIRIYTVDNSKIISTDVKLDDKSKVDAEEMNLDQVPKTPSFLNDIEVSAFVDNSSDFDNINENKVDAVVYEVNNDMSINDISEKSLKDYILSESQLGAKIIPVITISKENNFNDYETLATNIDNTLKKDKYSSVEISSNFIDTSEDYNAFIKALYTKLSKDNIGIIVNLPPKWGDTISYAYLKSFTKFYSKLIDYVSLSTYASEIRIDAYNYTTPYSAFAGEIAPVQWVEKVIQYYINIGVPRYKLSLNINDTGYKWDETSIVNTYKENYMLNTKQITILHQSDIRKINFKFNDITPQGWDENLVQFIDDKSILVYPSEKSITNIKQLVQDYGLKGYAIID